MTEEIDRACPACGNEGEQTEDWEDPDGHVDAYYCMECSETYFKVRGSCQKVKDE